jgi:hypothetical protein
MLSDSTIRVLFDCAQSPVGVQLVLPVHTAIWRAAAVVQHANLLWPICAELLNMRFCSRSPISAESLFRASALVVSQTVEVRDAFRMADFFPAALLAAAFFAAAFREAGLLFAAACFAFRTAAFFFAIFRAGAR